MNVNDEVEVGCILAQKDIQLYSIGSFRTSTIYAVCEEGMAPREGSNIEWQSAHLDELFPASPSMSFKWLWVWM